MYSFQLRPIQTISRFGFQLPAARFNERKSKQQMVGPPQLNKHTYLAKLFHQPRFPSWNKGSSLPKTTIWGENWSCEVAISFDQTYHFGNHAAPQKKTAKTCWNQLARGCWNQLARGCWNQLARGCWNQLARGCWNQLARGCWNQLARGCWNQLARGCWNQLARGCWNQLARGCWNQLARGCWNQLARGCWNQLARGCWNQLAKGCWNQLARGCWNQLARGGGWASHPIKTYVPPIESSSPSRVTSTNMFEITLLDKHTKPINDFAKKIQVFFISQLPTGSFGEMNAEFWDFTHVPSLHIKSICFVAISLLFIFTNSQTHWYLYRRHMTLLIKKKMHR